MDLEFTFQIVKVRMSILDRHDRLFILINMFKEQKVDYLSLPATNIGKTSRILSI